MWWFAFDSFRYDECFGSNCSSIWPHGTYLGELDVFAQLIPCPREHVPQQVHGCVRLAAGRARGVHAKIRVKDMSSWADAVSQERIVMQISQAMSLKANTLNSVLALVCMCMCVFV